MSDNWPPFIVPWDDIDQSPTDMSSLLPSPAGKDGFIQKLNGHLATGDGQRWRFWGVGMVFSSWFPPTHLAGIVARRLAKYGINCLRLHHLDHRWPSGILKRYDQGTRGPGMEPPGRYAHPGNASTRELDPEAMARLDWFIYCCKENGIYVDFNLNVTRRFSAGDGVREPEALGYSKAITYYDERLVELQKEYARQLLTHVNPFTGNRYADEPAVAMIEVLNENSLLRAWVRGYLEVGGPGKDDAANWHTIPASYSNSLTVRFNRWLAAKYPDRESLAQAWEGDLQEYEDARQGTVRRLQPKEFEGATKRRFHDNASFYHEIEQTFFTEMESYLRGELGVKQLLVATSDWDHGWSALPSLEAEARLDILDGHAYWRAIWNRMSTVRHEAQVDVPDTSMPALLSRTVVDDHPYIVSEINESFPNDFACEMLPLVTAYALLQDWDGIYWHSYTGGHYGWDEIWQDQSIKHHLRMCNDPLKMTQMAICGLMFHRGDVAAAKATLERKVTPDFMLESLRQPKPENGNTYWLPDLPGRASLVHRVALVDFAAQENAPAPGEYSFDGDEIVSDTGELTWEARPNDGRLLINTPMQQGVVMRRGKRSTANLTVDLDQDFAAVQLASLDAKPIAEAERLLLVAVSRVANTGMRWADESRTAIEDWGAAPTRIEPVAAVITLEKLHKAQSVRLQPLDGQGHPCGNAISGQAKDGSFWLALPEAGGTPWYLITVER